MFLPGTLESQSPSSTNKRVIHVWVDPHYGNDSAINGASILNPAGSACGSSNRFKPADVLDSSQNNAVLLHAPYPFKTINGPTGALNYIPSLPYTSAVTGITWEYAIIHLLPGWYAPTTLNPNSYVNTGTQGPWHYRSNSVLASQEDFPIYIPDHVSIQGTSALNTVFHLEAPNGSTNPQPAFVFGKRKTSNSPLYTGVGSFISSISIFGSTLKNVNKDYEKYAAIYFGTEAACHTTITNCWIFSNTIGILLDAPTSAQSWHQVTIANNTFVWNGAALWNGQSQNSNSQGVSRSILLNNIFDRTLPSNDSGLTWPYGFPHVPGAFRGVPTFSAFEGIADEDLRITAATGSNPQTGIFNAWENIHYNLAIKIGNLPITTLPSGLTNPSNSPVNLSAITGNTSNLRRGILFIRDLFQNGRFKSGSGTYYYSPQSASHFDYCLGDFRLAPSVANAASEPQAPSNLNPLIDRGWSPTTGSNFPITFGNGRTLSNPPGFLALGSNQSTWPYSNWEFDCEGYGNPRILDHPKYVNYQSRSLIDLGADESGLLIIAGYRFGTTNFIKDLQPVMIPNTDSQENHYLWYIGPSNHTTAQSSGSIYSPLFRVIIPQTSSEYDDLPWTSSSWTFAPPSNYYSPQRVDITPALLADIHPYWSNPNVFNPIWQPCQSGYNQALYWNPTAALINPPGTYPVFGSTFQWLDSTPVGNPPQDPYKRISDTTDFFNFYPHYNDNFPQFAYFVNTDSWGRWYPSYQFPPQGTFITLQGTSGVARRYSMEFGWVGDATTGKNTPFGQGFIPSNMQTYTVLVEGTD